MSDAASFAKFVPGFDFLQNLSKGTSSPMPGVSSWVAPTLDPEELEKRITDLKAVLFWLEQNTTALKATIQALEVQKMTLATLKGMNMDMSAMAKAFQFPDFTGATQAQQTQQAQQDKQKAEQEAKDKADQAKARQQAKEEAQAVKQEAEKKQAKAAEPATSNLDPLQLWGSLTQQFQQIASQALQDVTKAQASASGVGEASGAVKKAATQKSAPKKVATQKIAKKPAAKRPAARKSA